MRKRLEEAMKDKDFAEKLMALEEPEDVRKALLEKDVDLSVEEIKQIAELMSEHADDLDELTEDELEEAAGGLSPTTTVSVTLVCVTLAKLIVDAVRRRW